MSAMMKCHHYKMNLFSTKKAKGDMTHLSSPDTQNKALVYDAEIADNKCVYQAVPSGHTLRLRTSQPFVDISISVSLNEDPVTYNELPIVLKTECKLHSSFPERPPSPIHAPPSYCFY